MDTVDLCQPRPGGGVGSRYPVGCEFLDAKTAVEYGESAVIVPLSVALLLYG